MRLPKPLDSVTSMGLVAADTLTNSALEKFAQFSSCPSCDPAQGLLASLNAAPPQGSLVSEATLLSAHARMDFQSNKRI